jgi:Pentapeptide repeats (8 copies)
MLKSARRTAGILTLAALLVGGAMVLAPTQAQAMMRNCTPGPGLNLAGCNYSNADLSFANFSGSNLTGANLSGADLNGTNFTGADLKRTNLSGAGIVENCTPNSCLFDGPFFGGPGIQFDFRTSPNFTNAKLKDANLQSVRLGGATVDEGQTCTLTHCIEVFAFYPDAVLAGVTSGGITGTPASLPGGWELINGYLAPIIPGPQITTTSLPDGTVKSPYSASVAASGGNPPTDGP